MVEQPYDVIVYVSGTSVIAERADGTQLFSGTFNSGTNDTTAIDTAFNVANTSGKHTIVVIKPGTYFVPGPANIKLWSNLTVYAYGVTVKYTGASPFQAFNPITTTAARGIQNVQIFGLTLDCNNLCGGMLMYGRDDVSQTKNVTLRDCSFKRPYDRLLLQINYLIERDPATGKATSIPSWKNENIHIINCTFDSVGAAADNTFEPLELINCRQSSIIGCKFGNAESPMSGACAIFMYSIDIVIADCQFYNNVGVNKDVADLWITNASNIRIVNNEFSGFLWLIDSRYVTVTGNRLRRIRIADFDEAFPDLNISQWRGTRHVVIAGNQFNTHPPAFASVTDPTDYAINIDPGGNAENAPKHILITGNEARCVAGFVKINPLPNNATDYFENIMIEGNHIAERTSTTDHQNALITINGNTTVEHDGIKGLFITNNYFCPKNAALTTGTPYDVDLTTTGMTTVSIRENVFSNLGVSNLNSYAQVTNNFGLFIGGRDSNAGIATVPAAATSVVVNHGVGYTPGFRNIQVSPTNNGGNVTYWWFDSMTATSFTIHATPAPGGTGATFAWQVARR